MPPRDPGPGFDPGPTPLWFALGIWGGPVLFVVLLVLWEACR